MVHIGIEGRQTSLGIEGERNKESLIVSHILYTVPPARDSVKWAPVTHFFFVTSTTFLVCSVGEELCIKQPAGGSYFF